jgi:TonB dependent receptor/TonB-dependent Receptor Plug Domain
MSLRARLLVALLCLFAAAQARPAIVGEPLADALAALQSEGLRLVFSTAVVRKDYRVREDPGSGTPLDRARRLLAPYGLTLEQQATDVWVVVASQVRDESRAVVSRDLVAAEPQEVTVYASRIRVSTQGGSAPAEIGRADLEQLPSLDQDVLRVARYLPGMATNGVSSRPFVRGGRQNEVGVYFDSAPVYDPFHFKDFQGLLGVLDPAVVDRLDFYTGVLPVKFGNRLSGVIDITPRRADHQDRYVLGLSPLYASAVSTGRTESRDIEWLGALRISPISLVLESDRGLGRPKFLDALARVSLPLGTATRITAGWLLLDDRLESFGRDDDPDRGSARYRDATGWLRVNRALTENLHLGATLAHTERHADRRGVLDSAQRSGTLTDNRFNDATTLRSAFAWRTLHWHTNVGLEASYFDSSFSYESAMRYEPRFARAFGRPTSEARSVAREASGAAYSAFAHADWRPTDTFALGFGARWDAQRYGADFADEQLAPRVVLEYRPIETTTLRIASGRSFQPERPDELLVQDGEPVYHDVQRLTQHVVGVEHRPRRGVTLRVEGFEKKVAAPTPVYENLLDPFAAFAELEVDRARVAPESSRIYGIEAGVRLELAPQWSAWANYAWTEASDRFANNSAPRTWDQRNSVAAGGAYRYKAWQFSGSVLWRNGWRRTVLELSDASTGALALGPRNAATYPAFFSIDLRATWEHKLPRGQLLVYGDIGNASNRGNACCTVYELTENRGSWQLEREFDTSLPRYVFFGATWELP